jgi:hypothetical protein
MSQRGDVTNEGHVNRGQFVFDPERHLGVDVPGDEAVACQVAQRVG